MDGEFGGKTTKKFPYEIRDVDADLNEELLADYPGQRGSFLQVGPKRWFLPNQYRKSAEIFHNFQARPDDVWTVSYPRTGSTMTQEIVWLLANNLDYDRVATVRRADRFPSLEFSTWFHPEFKEELRAENRESAKLLSFLEHLWRPTWPEFDETTEKRFIKTHLPFDMLPPDLLEVGCKVVYIARNPKDVAVSYYHFHRTLRLLGYSKDFPKFWNYFQRGLQLYGPFWSHLKEGWERRSSKNLLFLFYEDINKDLNAALRKIATFLGKSYSDEEFLQLKEYIKIDNFKKSPSIKVDLIQQLGLIKPEEQDFVRKGGSGGWKDYFPPDLNRRADEWIKENLKGTDLKFPEF